MRRDLISQPYLHRDISNRQTPTGESLAFPDQILKSLSKQLFLHMSKTLYLEPFSEQLEKIERLRAAQAVSHSQGQSHDSYHRRRFNNQNGHHSQNQQNQQNQQNRQFLATAAAAAAIKQNQAFYPASSYSPMSTSQEPSRNLPLLYQHVDSMSALMASQNRNLHHGQGGQNSRLTYASEQNQSYQDHQGPQDQQSRQDQQMHIRSQLQKHQEKHLSQVRNYHNIPDIQSQGFQPRDAFNYLAPETNQTQHFGSQYSTFSGNAIETALDHTSILPSNILMAAKSTQSAPSVFSAQWTPTNPAHDTIPLNSQHTGARSQSPSAHSLFSTRTLLPGHPTSSLGDAESAGSSETDLSLENARAKSIAQDSGNHPENLSQSSLLRSIWMPQQTNQTCAISLTNSGKW